MRLSTILGLKVKLWQLLLGISVVGFGVALLPERIGVPVAFIIEGTLMVIALACLLVWVYLKLMRSGRERHGRGGS